MKGTGEPCVTNEDTSRVRRPGDRVSATGRTVRYLCETQQLVPMIETASRGTLSARKLLSSQREGSTRGFQEMSVSTC